MALDPGGRLSFAGINRNLQTNEETSIRYYSASYRYDSGQLRNNKKYHQLTNEVLKIVQKDRNKILDHALSMADPTNFVE